MLDLYHLTEFQGFAILGDEWLGLPVRAFARFFVDIQELHSAESLWSNPESRLRLSAGAESEQMAQNQSPRASKFRECITSFGRGS